MGCTPRARVDEVVLIAYRIGASGWAGSGLTGSHVISSMACALVYARILLAKSTVVRGR